ncbi:hypothetical protein KRX11_10410 [Pasteurellaceae bacterium TAE3-ERU1]|nr:hypothetical protein [Pasteurellaceae bacterium TAE3-ERU1]
MSQGPVKFELFRYQLLPIDRYTQTDFVSGINSTEELIKNKNKFFAEAVNNTKEIKSKKSKVLKKALYDKSDFFLFKIALNKTILRETEEFKSEVIESWPSILVAIWNDPDKQIIAIQKRSCITKSLDEVVKMILNSIESNLRTYQLTAIYEPMFEKNYFWAIVNEHDGKIKSIEFEIVTPNMANISYSLSEDIKDFAKATNSTRNKLKLESDPASSLSLDKDNKTLNGLVNYSSEGGGNISLKINGIKNKIHTSKTVKTVEISELEINGSAEKIVDSLKEIL